MQDLESESGIELIVILRYKKSKFGNLNWNQKDW